MRQLQSLSLLLLISLATQPMVYADGGMWLLEQMKDREQEMRARGLDMPIEQIYSPTGAPDLQDAVVMFDGGCSGVFVSSQGLILTNHHCGYDRIQEHSTIEHNYLEDGFWSVGPRGDLPNPGLEVIIIDKIEDVTTQVTQLLTQEPYRSDEMAAFSIKTLSQMIPTLVGEEKMNQPGIRYELKPFFQSNKFYLFTQKVFTDVRLVAAPPSSIGKYGADTDNWSWPRHTGDFSIFRVYADEHNNPADYSPHNRPYQPRRYARISTRGVERGDFAMIMGFPGTTYHYFTEAEVEEWAKIDNNIRIEMRGLRQEVMLRRMLADPQINIMYAAKYAYSQNGYKRAQGANWAIQRRALRETKRRQQDALAAWAKQNNRPEILQAINDIATAVANRREARYAEKYITEGILIPIEFTQAPAISREKASELWSKPASRTELLEELKRGFKAFYNKDYSPEVDREVASILLTRYTERVAPSLWPQALSDGVAQHGSVAAYVDYIFAHSIYASPEHFEAFIQHPSLEQITEDPMSRFTESVIDLYHMLSQQQSVYDNPVKLAQRLYTRGMMDMHGMSHVWPDANLTQRFTFGQVQGYAPRDNVYYGHQTTLTGVMEKEDPNNWEYVLPERLKEIYRTKSYGAFAMSNGEMPVNFCATTHTTGGNSGSPVFNSHGELIGLNFDRNWEGVGGDIEYLPNYQRSIILDVRYLLMIVEQYGQSQYLVDEMLGK